MEKDWILSLHHIQEQKTGWMKWIKNINDRKTKEIE